MIEIFADEKEDFAPAQEKEAVRDDKSLVYERKSSNCEIYPIKLRNIQCSGFDENKKCRPVPADQHNVSSKQRKGRNTLKKYINRFYKICLLNLAAAVTMLIIYLQTGNELLTPAIYACVINGLLTYMCVE